MVRRAAAAKASRAKRAKRAIRPEAIEGARRAPLPSRFEAERAVLVKSPPEGEEWLHEQKFDGYRMLCVLDHGRARFLTRNAKDWTAAVRSVAEAAEALPVGSAILDGEIVAIDERGITSFQLLQNALGGGHVPLAYFVFDLLYLDGFDLRRASLVDRKAALLSILPARDAILRYSDHVAGSGADFFREACRHGLEGIVSKRAHSTYEGGPRGAWVKTKCTRRQELVIGGYTEPKGARSGLGALLVGVYDGDTLVYSGKVGTGFDHRTLIDLEAKLRRIETPAAPFAVPPHVPRSERVHWVKPDHVAEIEFMEWTGDGMLRHPSFKGLREDKPAREVVREGARPAPRDGKPEDKVTHKKTAVKRAPSRIASNTSGRAPRRAARPAEDTVAGVRISHPDRVLDPQSGFTKLDLARLFESLEDRMVPHYRGRAMMILRCPGGVAAACFVQKHEERPNAGAVRTVTVPEKDGEKPHLTVTDLASLIGLVQLGGLEFHVWGSRADKVELPDRLIFDLDPDPEVGWREVKQAALELRERFRGMKLESFLRTTGGKGVHVVVPIARRQSWDVAKEFCLGVAQSMVHDAPDRFTAQMSKAKRHGRIFVDWLRNGRGATAVGPYSTRVKPGLPIATPIAWDELAALKGANVWTVSNLPQRIAKLRRDPWEGIDDVRQSLPKMGPRVSVTR